MSWKSLFVKDVKALILGVVGSVITAGLLWEASSIVSIKERLAGIEATLKVHIGAAAGVTNIAGEPPKPSP